MTTQTETTETTETTPQEVLFELVTVDGATYRKGENAPAGTVTDLIGTDIPVRVESYEGAGDWIDVQLADGYSVSVPEVRIARLVTRTL
ncbi:hypothetical protein [Streptomyces sp. NPDC058240]|uniref:hypothetical protein n=1 Tax=Streptomyces sp. NPDC058240 TaxID=3346396 RepID=UPI0036F1702A